MKNSQATVSSIGQVCPKQKIMLLFIALLFFNYSYAQSSVSYKFKTVDSYKKINGVNSDSFTLKVQGVISLAKKDTLTLSVNDIKVDYPILDKHKLAEPGISYLLGDRGGVLIIYADYIKHTTPVLQVNRIIGEAVNILY
jgi:hypothetical protein